MSLLTRSLRQPLSGPLGIRAASTSARVLQYEASGSPLDVLSLKEQAVADPQSGEVLVEMLAAPVHPADLGQVNGTYPIRPTLPAVGGTEGVGRITKVGSAVAGLKEGDVVVHTGVGGGPGTWRTAGVFKAEALYKPKKASQLAADQAACMVVNGLTADCLLRNFGSLTKGDVVIQNGGSSQVAQTVVQLAAKQGIHTVTIMRQRANWEEVVERIKKSGSDKGTGAQAIVVTDEFVRTPEFRKLVSDLPPAKLGLNAIGGTAATDVARVLGDNGVLVTYGGMSRRPVAIPTSHLIFRDISARGFWLARYLNSQESSVVQKSIDRLADMMSSEELVFWTEVHKLDSYRSVLEVANRSFRDRKLVLSMQ